MQGINPSNQHIKELAALDSRADPEYFQNNAYVVLGLSRENLGVKNMPSHADILEKSNASALITQREVLSDSRPSREALLGREITPIPLPQPTRFFPDDLGSALALMPLHMTNV